jgi:hypothetical protein
MLPALRIPVLLLVLTLGLAACRTPEPKQPPPVTMARTAADAAQGSPAIAGTYTLQSFVNRYLPARAAMADGCPVYLDAGTLDLTADGRYRLAVTARSVCGRDARSVSGEIVKEGVYALAGSHLRFGDRIVITNDEPAPETTSGPAVLNEALFPYGRFSARGTFRAAELTVTLDNLRTLSFAVPAQAAFPQPSPSPSSPAAAEAAEAEVPVEEAPYAPPPPDAATTPGPPVY